MQVSTVAIGMISFFTFPIIVLFLETFLTKTKINLVPILYGLLILLSVFIISPKIDFNDSITLGVFWGLLSAFFVALRHTIVKVYLSEYNSFSIIKWHTLIVCICYIPFVLFDFGNFIPSSSSDWWYLILLALITTVLGHSLFVRGMKSFNARVASIFSSVQILYGGLMAYFILSETPTINTIVGGLIIISVVIHQGVYFKKSKDI
ncbi:MAG: Unknown protein [uncultured Campylobacterales bacterium]|uniref:EamA domain-containing protein n=1 Tax=uncultured Campylobacterales bacterium TaxID=352960 RepID=A0A6S6T5B6_9BACT|nr:MAG: Unknown protein [uncultured Campylobacterales bacterium]